MAQSGFAGSGAHPHLDALVAEVRSAAVEEHLAGCPRCRVDARMARGALGGDASALPGIDRARARLTAARAEATITFTRSLTESPTDGAGRLADELWVGQRIDGYEIMRPIGRGAMSSVYRIRREDDAATFALKVLASASSSARQRLLREAAALGALDHPNIVAVFDVLDVLGVPGLVLEYVDGPSLAVWLREHGPASLELADQLASGIVAGLTVAHRAGLVHRDLKPSNILLAPGTDGTWTPKIADFGLVRSMVEGLADSLQTPLGISMGTPPYMAPEQIRDAHSAGIRSDVFSLGAVLFELVTGRRAFPGSDLLDVYERIREGRHEDLGPDIAPRVARTIDRALRPDPDERWPDAVSLLTAWLGHDSDS